LIPAPSRWGILSVMVWLAARPSILNACERINQFFLTNLLFPDTGHLARALPASTL